MYVSKQIYVYVYTQIMCMYTCRVLYSTVPMYCVEKLPQYLIAFSSGWNDVQHPGGSQKSHEIPLNTWTILWTILWMILEYFR